MYDRRIFPVILIKHSQNEKSIMLDYQKISPKSGDTSTWRIQSSGTVTIGDDLTKKMYWKLVVVVKVIKGRDGQIRAAVKTINHNSKPSIIHCSVKQLIPMEVQSNDCIWGFQWTHSLDICLILGFRFLNQAPGFLKLLLSTKSVCLCVCVRPCGYKLHSRDI